MEHRILVETKNLKKYFHTKHHSTVKAVDDVSFHMHCGEILSLIGESGSGKSTVARCIMDICRPSSGEIIYDGLDITDRKVRRQNSERLRREIQMVFQDTASSLDPRMNIEQIVTEPLYINKMGKNRAGRRELAEKQLCAVGLDGSFLAKYPSEISGGQRQRAAIARALCMSPRLVIADEPISSLDVSIQAQIINLFKTLHGEHGFSFLLIAHDLSMAKFISDRVAVMCRGRIVEIGPAKEVCENPLHQYTKALVSSVPVPDPAVERHKKTEVFTDYEAIGRGTLELVTADHWVMKEEAK